MTTFIMVVTKAFVFHLFNTRHCCCVLSKLLRFAVMQQLSFKCAGGEPTKHFKPVYPRMEIGMRDGLTWFSTADSLGGSSSSRISHLVEELPATHTPEDT